MTEEAVDNVVVRLFVLILLILPVILLVTVIILCSLPFIALYIGGHLLFLIIFALFDWSLAKNTTIKEELQKHWKQMKLHFWIR